MKYSIALQFFSLQGYIVFFVEICTKSSYSKQNVWMNKKLKWRFKVEQICIVWNILFYMAALIDETLTTSEVNCVQSSLKCSKMHFEFADYNSRFRLNCQRLAFIVSYTLNICLPIFPDHKNNVCWILNKSIVNLNSEANLMELA